jgi:hypothetical protein
MSGAFENGFFSPDDRARVMSYDARPDREERQRRAAELRRQNEQAAAEVQGRLPVSFQPGVVRPRYQGPPIFPRGPATVHIMLLEPLSARGIVRVAGDWLCSAALDESTGELKYEGKRAEQWADGTGGPGAYYDPAPSCKKCLKKLDALWPK